MRAIKLDVIDHKIILIGVGLIIFTILFPPWIHTFDWSGNEGGSIHSEKPAGYGFIFSPPSPEKKSGAYGIQIDFTRIFLQWLLISATCVAIIMCLHIEKSDGIIELTDIVLEKEKRLTKGEVKQTPDPGEEWAKKYIRDVLGEAVENPDNTEAQAKAKRIKTEQ